MDCLGCEFRPVESSGRRDLAVPRTGLGEPIAARTLSQLSPATTTFNSEQMNWRNKTSRICLRHGKLIQEVTNYFTSQEFQGSVTGPIDGYETRLVANQTTASSAYSTTPTLNRAASSGTAHDASAHHHPPDCRTDAAPLPRPLPILNEI